MRKFYMKKLVIAAALVVASIGAQAQVTISGKVSEWVDSSKVGSTSRVTTLWGEPTNNIAVNVKENLGKGLAVRATVETSLGGNTFGGDDTRLGDRQSTVGLETNVVSVDLGRNVHSQFLAITTNDVFSTLYGSVAGDVHNLRGLRFSDGVFVSLTPVKNIRVSADRSVTATGQEITAFGLSTQIRNVSVAVAQYDQGSEKSTVLGLGANLKSLRVTYTHSNDKGVVASKGDLLGVSTKMDRVTLKASYGRTNADVKAYALGADYHFSKRTEVGVAYRNVDRVGSTADVAQIGVGLTHRF